MTASETAKSIATFLGILMFVIGLILMAVAEHVDAVFAVGFLLFIASIMMALTAVIWRISCDVDRFLGNLGGDPK